MGYRLEKFAAGSMDKGLSVRSSDFQVNIAMDADTYNMTSGINEGIGPRYGMAPLLGHMGAEPISGVLLPTLQRAEEATNLGRGFISRLKVLGVFPIRLTGCNNLAQTNQCYAFIVTSNASTDERLDIVLCANYNSVSNVEDTTPNIDGGFGGNSINTGQLNPSVFVAGILQTAGSRVTPLKDYLQLTNTLIPYASCTSATVTLADIPMQWLFGNASDSGDATHAPSVAFQYTYLPVAVTFSNSLACGVPTEYNLQNFRAGQRAIKVIGINSDGNYEMDYSVIFDPTTTIMKPDRLGRGNENLHLSTTTATHDGGSSSYSNNVRALVNDPAGVTNPSYKAIFVAQNKAFACLFQDAYRDNSGKFNQWFDLTQNSLQPPNVSSSYRVDGVRTKSCFLAWPEYVDGTAMLPGGLGGSPQLGPADSGILRKNTAYEFTYSLYDRRLNYETNVGAPVSFRTGNDDFIGLQLFQGAHSGTTNALTIYSLYSLYGYSMMPFAFNGNTSPGETAWVGTRNFINFTDYRFYVRQKGSYDWIPALTMPAAQYWFYPHRRVYACAGPVPGGSGGQPAGASDYSQLESDSWIDVKVYKNRTFWCSNKQIRFSLSNNFFAYPVGNSIAAPAGEFRGMKLHNYPGQAEQSSRLVIFGSEGTYVARFSGTLSTRPVQVDLDGNFADLLVDGSNLEIDPWTSVTAFSHRAAEVADGILYWWGQQGIYRDDGVSTPTKISLNLEPDLFDLYDPSAIDQIHAHYDPTSKEITWFYQARTTDGSPSTIQPTQGIVYNVYSQTFRPVVFTGVVDWMQNLNIETSTATAGKRAIVGVRDPASLAVQRAYFFDLRNRAGDMRPLNDLSVKQVSTPSGLIRRLTLAAGFNATNLATIAIGDKIAIQQAKAYAGSANLPNAVDMVARVVAVGANSIDILLPAGGALDNVTLISNKFFPIWHEGASTTGLNGIPWKATTTYWMPKGINGYYRWMFTYLLHKLSLWAATDPLTYSFAYRSPTSVSLLTDTLTLTNNSDGTCQIYHPMGIGGENAEGQALKFVFSGTHIGHEWVLQYLESHCTPIEGDNLRRFEG